MAQLRDLLVNGASRFLGVVNFNDEVNISKTLTLLNTTDASLGVNATKPALLIGSYNGEHLEIDPNEIMAKKADGTATRLNLNADGGSTFVGGELVIKGDLIPSTDSAATKLIGTSSNKWTHIYATNVTATTFTGSLTGNATSADKLTVNAGGDTTPVYFKNGVPTACAGPLSVGITGNAASATKVFVTDNDSSTNLPTSGTSYYLSYSTGKGSNQSLRANADLIYYDTGTESRLNIGNSDASIKHKGTLRLHNNNGYYSEIVSSSTGASKTFTLPDTSGTAVVLETKASEGQTTSGTITELNIYGPCYGNDKTNVITEGKLSYGDPGPQIRFSNKKKQETDTESIALIYTNHNTIQDGNSLSLVSTNGDKATFIAPKIRALSGFIGNGAAITDINAANIATGTLASARLPVVPVTKGGTGISSVTKNSGALVADGSSDNKYVFRAITNNTSATAVSASTNLITANTLYYHKGNSNIVTVGTITSGTWKGTKIDTAYGGTGATEHTANRLVWSASTTQIQASGNHYADGNHIGVNYSTQPTTTFRVGGTSYLDGNTNIEGELTLASSVKFVYNNTDKCVDVIFN